jgi:hypothetical protein
VNATDWPYPWSRLEQLAWNVDVDPDEIREWLRDEIERRKAMPAPDLVPSRGSLWS